MTATARFLAPAALLFLAGCATAPTPAPSLAPTPFVTSSGLVIGTLSYQYVEAGDEPAWTVRFERIDGPAKQEYSLPVEVDEATHQGFFGGTLPAGVYAFREAASAKGTFDTGSMKVPFEVQAGEIKDTGHFALNPILSSRR